MGVGWIDIGGPTFLNKGSPHDKSLNLYIYKILLAEKNEAELKLDFELEKVELSPVS